jgi:hypothetical protein
MNVKNFEITTSPISPGRICVRADVICDDQTVPPEVYWVDVPQAHSNLLSRSGNPWLPLLLPFAVSHGEPLVISKPADRELFDGARDSGAFVLNSAPCRRY